MLSISKNLKIGIIGCGKMAGAILGGIAKNDFIPKQNIFLYDINSSASQNLSLEYGFNTVNSIDTLSKSVDVLFLSVKPFVIDDVLKQIAPFYKNQLVMSIVAGVRIEKYKTLIPNIKIIRIMPNTPALVSEGMSAIVSDTGIDDFYIDFAFRFMSNCSKVIRTTEDKIDIITALSGSGPAFYFKIIELLAKSAHKLGLDYNDALLLSAQTALGSAKMIFENDFNITQLIKNVTTPGGCTEVGNFVLSNSNIEDIFDKLITDTMQKSIELGK